MKKQIILFFALFLAGTAFAQDKKLYLSLGPGVGLGTARIFDLYQDGSKAYPVGLGKELNINLRAGFFVNEFVAVELGVVYHNGFNTKFNLTNFVGFYSFKSSNSGTGFIKFSGNMLQLVPALVLMPKLGNEKMKPYVRLGIIVGIMPSIMSKEDFTYDGIIESPSATSLHDVVNFKASGGIAIGGSTAIGCDYKLSDLLAIYAELYYDALSYAPTKGKYTKFEENGIDLLAAMSTRQKEVTYVKDATTYQQGTQPASDPYQKVKNSYPFNSFGLNLGVKIKL